MSAGKYRVSLAQSAIGSMRKLEQAQRKSNYRFYPPKTTKILPDTFQKTQRLQKGNNSIIDKILGLKK